MTGKGAVMKHDYYSYTKEQLLENPKMKLFCLEDNAAVFKQMAEQMAEEIKAHNAEEGTPSLSVR